MEYDTVLAGAPIFSSSFYCYNDSSAATITFHHHLWNSTIDNTIWKVLCICYVYFAWTVHKILFILVEKSLFSLSTEWLCNLAKRPNQAPRPSNNPPYFTSVYEAEHINFVVWLKVWLDCYSCWFVVFWFRSIEFAILCLELDWYWLLHHKVNSLSFSSMYYRKNIWTHKQGVSLGWVVTASPKYQYVLQTFCLLH
jgi:hypothetical protein